jgi:hypothetical protein
MAADPEKIKELENKSSKLFREALPQIMFLMGIIGGVILNLYADILHDQWSGKVWYIPVVSLIVLVLFIFFFWIINRVYLKPLNRIDKEIDNLKKLK